MSTALQADGLWVDHAQAGRLPLTIVPELDARLAWGGHGKAQFALHTRHLLDHVGHVDLVVCAGAAGALANGIAVGDIVIATRTIGSGHGRHAHPLRKNLGLAMRNLATLLSGWLRPR